MINLLITISECVYIIYIMCFFKTKKNFAHPLSYFENKLLYHPIDNLNYPENLICPLGHIFAYLSVIFILVRNFLSINMKKIYLEKYHKKILIIVFIFSLANFNALIYLMPVFIYELFFYPFLNK